MLLAESPFLLLLAVVVVVVGGGAAATASASAFTTTATTATTVLLLWLLLLFAVALAFAITAIYNHTVAVNGPEGAVIIRIISAVHHCSYSLFMLPLFFFLSSFFFFSSSCSCMDSMDSVKQTFLAADTGVL